MNLLTIKEAAEVLKVSEKTLRRWEEKNYITPIRTDGRHRRYSLEQLKEAKRNKNKIVISEVRQTINSDIDKVFKVVKESKTEVVIQKHLKPKVSYIFASFMSIALFSLGSVAALKIKSYQITDNKPTVLSESKLDRNAASQAVLAATSFKNAEFGINLPTVFSSTLTIGNDTFSDITGDGLSIVNGSLTAINTNTLGNDITSSEIVDGTISEVDLLSSNTPSSSQVLTFNSTTGGFTWTNQTVDTDTVGTNYFTDSGDITYLTATGDDFAIGGTSSTAPFYIDSSTGTINLTKTAAGKWINFSDGTDEWGLYNNAGSPEGVITANTGTLAMDTLNGTLYVKTDDSDSTSWVNLATGATSPWTETGGLITLVTTSNNVNLGGSTDLGKLAIDGDTDEVQFLIQGNSTQTSDLAVFENSSGADLLKINNTGLLTLGSNGVDGSLSIYNELGATDYSVNFQTSSSQTGNVTYTLPIDDGGTNYVLSSDGSGVLSWQSVLGIGGMGSFILSGDSGSDQTITDANILKISGGVNGIDSTTSATDTITLDIDTTEIGENTFGNNTDPSIVWTFDQSGTTDPTLTFSDGLIAVGGDLAISGGNVTTAVTFDSTLATTGTLTTNGALTANGTVTLGDNGDTVTINSSDWDISATGDLTGIGNITIDGRFDTAAHANNNGFNLPTSSGAPSAVTGTAEGDIVYDTTNDTLYIYDGGSFTTIGGGGYSGWTLDGDDADTESISSGNTAHINGGTNGIDTDVSATDTITLNFDATEVGTVTFGSGSAITWTFDASGGTDPSITFGSDLVTIGGDLAISGGNVTTAVTFDSTLTANAGVVLNPSGTNDITLGVDTDTLLTLDSTVTNGDNFVISPNNAGTGSTFTGTLTSSNLTADRTWTLKDADGTIAFTSDIPTSDNYQYFTLDGDDADTEQIASTNTLLVSGGTNGIDTDVSATDTITLNLDATEIGTTTFGSGSGITWTFDTSGGTDTTITFGNNTQTFTTGTATFSGNVVVNGGSLTLGTNGTDGALTLYSEMGGTDYSVIFQPSNSQTQNTTYTLPIAYAGANDYVLTSDTSGVLSWQQVTSVGGAGDITAVGDITTGAAFTATAGNDGNTLYFEGTTSNGNEIALTGGDPGSDIVVTIPAIAGTLASLSGTQTFDGIKSFSDAAGITIGLDAGTNTAGLLKLISAGANAFSTIFQTGTQSQDVTYTLPLNDGDTDYALTTDGAGVLTWKAIAGVGGVGDISAVGNITSGEAFTSGTPGTSLYFTSGGDINDANGNEVLTFTTTASAVNELTLANAATNGNVTLTATGSDTDIDIQTILKGTGTAIFSSTTASTDLIAIKPQVTTATGSFTGTLTSSNLTADRTWTLKDADGTLAFLTDIPTSDNYSSWTLTGDTGTPQTISSADTGTIAGGTNGIDTVAGATDTITLNLDTTEIGTNTFGSGSAIVWTFDASGGTDTTITFGNNLITIGQGLTVTGSTILNGSLTANGTVALGDNGDTVAIDSSDWDINTTGDMTGIGAIALDGDITNTQATPSILLVDSTGASDDYSINVDGSTFTIVNDTDTRTDISISGTGDVTFGGDIAINGGDITTAVTLDSTLTVTGTTTLNGATTVNDDFTVALTGNENVEITDGATPTTDTLSLVSNGATITTGVNAAQIDFTTGDGSNATNSGLEINMASGGTSSGDITNAINLTMDAGDSSIQKGLNFADNNFDTDINATTDLTFGIGGANELTLTATDFSPSTSDGNALGTSSLMWGDLFLASGAVINFNASDVTITHSTDTLSFAGGDYNFDVIDGKSANIDGDGSPTADILVLGASDVIATDQVDGLAISFAAADGTNLTNSAINISLTSNGTTSGDLMRGLFIDLASVANAASTNKAIEIENTTAWDIDIELQNDETIDNITDGTITLTAPIVLTSSALTVTGTLTANGTVNLGDGGDVVTISGSDTNIAVIDGSTINIDGDGTPTADIVQIGSGDSTAVDGVDGLNITFAQTDDNAIDTNAGLHITITSSNDLDAEDSLSGIKIDSSGAVNTAGTFYGINIDNLTLTSADAAIGIIIGTGWSQGISSSSPISASVSNPSQYALTGAANNVTTNNVSGISGSITTLTGAGVTNNAISATINNAPVDAADIINGVLVTGAAQNVASTTQNLIFVDPASSGNSAGNLNGITIDTIATPGSATETAMNIGSGWDTDINATTSLEIGIDGTNEVTLSGTNLSASTAEGNSLGSATLEWEQLFLGDNNGVSFGLDQDWSIGYDEATDDRLELTTAGATGMLIQTANATGNSLNLTTNSLTTGTGFLVDNSANTLTTGTLLQAQSTGTSLTTAADAFLGYFDWTPGSATTASGDLFRINIGSNGNVTNVFNVTDGGSSLFRVSETGIESVVPHTFSAAGDVNIAYDLIFTNQTASTIDSYGPLTLRAGESFENNNLTLTTYGTGAIIADRKFSVDSQLALDDSTTPSVTAGNYFVENNSTNRLVTNFTNGTAGQMIYIEIGTSANFDLDCTGSSISCGSTDITAMATGDTISLIYDGTNWNLLSWMDQSANNADNTDGVDIAENFPSTETLSYGDVVKIDTQNQEHVIKSVSPYETGVIGIVSTNPGIILGQSDNSSYPIALAGRVPVKVSLENGPILAGDPLTSSSIAGVAMKATDAGNIIGKALQGYTSENVNEIGNIITFVNVGYNNPTPENAVSREEIEHLLQITEQNQQLLEESQNWNTNTATTSAEFNEVVTDNLFVTGIAAFNSLSASSTLTLNNNLVIGDGNIDSLTTPLNIQGSGAQSLNFMAGKVSIDTSGNMIIQGDLKVLGTLDANKVNVSNQIAGTASILAGTNDVTILNSNIKVGGLIFVTPTSPTKNSIYVKNQIDGQAVIGFDELEIPTITDINFNWWIVGITQ